MFKHIIILPILMILCCISCSDQADRSEETRESAEIVDPVIKEATFADELEMAHNKALFREKEAIQFDLLLVFSGKERLNATLTLLTNSSKGRIDMTNGEQIIYNQEKVFFSSGLEQPASVRFDAYTWSYFFLFPYKLSDPGTVWTEYPDDYLNGKRYDTQKLSFAPGTGDAPKDWYIVYADTTTHLIDVAAYIVTANKSQEKAEEDPHAIQYLEYTKVAGVPVATSWKFWEWRKEGGLTRELGNATVSNIQFVEVDENFFTPPDNYKNI